jgi:hypothetical protein
MKNLVYLDILRHEKSLLPEEAQTYKMELRHRLDSGKLTPELYDVLIQQIEKDEKNGAVR